MAKFFVLGAGGWGLGLALASHRAGHQVTVWYCFENEIEELVTKRENVRLLPGVKIPEEISFTTDISKVALADRMIVAVPSIYLRKTVEQTVPYMKEDTIVIDASKGIEDKTGLRMSQIIEEILPNNPIVALSGPTHAEEVGRGLPTSIVSASRDLNAAKQVQDDLMHSALRVYVNPDIIGVELGGALKNVIALAAGICDGMHAGDNCKAALMTRGLAEMARLGETLGANRETFFGLTGIGDMIVTCNSAFSRNHRAGVHIGKGLTPKQAVELVGTVEGFYAVQSAYNLAKEHGVEMPIVEQCYAVCYEDKDPRVAVEALMGRDKRQE
ncbi:MAG: NAD(P)-dependent glycerol-3-phosphate dehydrogenase [Clostridia bacterium]|nr:NAD(P)-dependent glycerol-3-phosphate dehydrogenase [Clostridia bacterium]